MMLTDSDARQILEVIRVLLEKIEAHEVLEGIEESRRLGVEESLSNLDGKEMKHVGAMRRRPLSPVEELNIVLHRLQERLVVLPRVAAAIRERRSDLPIAALLQPAAPSGSQSDRFCGRTPSVCDIRPNPLPNKPAIDLLQIQPSCNCHFVHPYVD